MPPGAARFAFWDMVPAMAIAPKNPIVFALDFATGREALDAAREVAPAIGMVKVGLELFVQEGPRVVGIFQELGLPVFLDLKLHDIPATVEGAVAGAAKLGARLLTVHASGGRTMLRRAVERAKAEGGTTDICAVTILTSLDATDLSDVGLGGTTADAARRLATMAWSEGVRWFVCSPAEVSLLRSDLGPDAVLVTPGVRPADGPRGDQKRVATPEQALRDGASWVVIGRPIRDAANRLEAAKAIVRSIEESHR